VACPITGNAYGDHASRESLLVPEVAGCLQERDAKGCDSDTKPGHLVPTVSPGMKQQTYVAFTQNQSGDVLTGLVAPSMGTNSNATGRNTPKVAAFQESEYGTTEYDVAGTQRADRPGYTTNVRHGMSVRRLTPTEAERLQGFPDGWTTGFADSTRYRMLGNAVAVPCACWIARRLAAINGRATL
jgi:DNA (cytosine-5)-methyltransferase 1